jgi:hypothetical protein
VRSSPVVVPGIFGHHTAQVPFAEDQHPVSDLRPGGEHEPLRISIRARTPRRDLDHFDTSICQDRVERRAELPGPVPDQEPEVRRPVTKVHQEVPDLLRSPWPVRVGGHAEDVHVTGADLHHEQDVQTLEGDRAVHVEEVSGEHRRGLHVQELPPRRIGVPLRRRRDRQRLEDPADCGGADSVTELEQLALDPLVSPAAVLGGEPPDQRGDLCTDWRPPRAVRIGPFRGDQAAVPP